MIEIRETKEYADWFARLKDDRAKARIDIRLRRMSLGNFGDVKSVGGGDKGSQRADIAKAREMADHIG